MCSSNFTYFFDGEITEEGSGSGLLVSLEPEQAVKVSEFTCPDDASGTESAASGDIGIEPPGTITCS